ncbi:IclR family transcriptional regulator [Yinghuangia sp. ASG 101]|uniref:IclR family transcriptional regulator n=1 Tax=Yinghuangia sp. ASG 101 TaxID=2896848 RepID=UPI001E476DE4|nr:IclR family transcriptional regulator [Yinghuangia sp. ASG 101]UGQ12967.1 IclR family transcriptional regulator [Yinghuangia sp. ASG 101]
MIEKVRCIIEALAARGPLGLTALSRETGISKSTVHRLCGELVAWGVVSRSREENAFVLGRHLSELAEMVPSSGSLRAIAHPYVAELFATFRLATSLSVLQDPTTVRCVEKIYAAGQDPANYWMGVGTRAPVHCTSAGKAILAFSPPHVFDAVVAQPLVAMTPFTLSGTERLARELAEIRRTGVAWTRNEIRMDCVAMAVPILAPSGAVVGALSVGLGAKAPRVPELEKAMKIQAGRIAGRLNRAG